VKINKAKKIFALLIDILPKYSGAGING